MLYYFILQYRGLIANWNELTGLVYISGNNIAAIAGVIPLSMIKNYIRTNQNSLTKSVITDARVCPGSQQGWRHVKNASPVAMCGGTWGRIN